MIGVSVICIGKLKEKFLQGAVDEYTKRLSTFCKFNITELSEERLRNESTAEIERVKTVEGEKILSKIPNGSLCIAMCIEGEQLTSEAFSRVISNAGNEGKSNVVFIIGGSYGLSDAVKNKADMKLSFSKMTFPHQLFRAMLCEQIYRAFTIEKGTKYHK